MKLLIIKPSSLGDIIHSLIVAQALKAQRPDAHITWVVRDTFAPVLESVEAVDRVISFNRKGGIPEFLRLLRGIRKERYDAVLEMQGLLRSGIMAWVARAPLKMGRRDGREGTQMFVNKLVDLPKGSCHAADILMEFLPALGLERMYTPIKLKEGSTPILTPGKEHRNPGLISMQPATGLNATAQGTETPQGEAQRGSGHNPENDFPSILIFPSARGKDARASKEWPFFKELTEKLCAELSKSDPKTKVAWCSDVRLDVPPCVLDFTGGKISLCDLMPFIAQAKLVISNDSGPMHMAAAVGIPLVALFGPTDPKRVGPYPIGNPQNRAIKSATGRIGDIGVAEVLQNIKELQTKPVA